MVLHLLHSLNENKTSQENSTIVTDIEFVPLKRISYREHEKLVMEFKCLVPQERAINAMDLIGKLIIKST